MANKPASIIAGLDAGSAATRCVAAVREAGRLRVVAAVSVASRGWNYGGIQSLADVTDCVRECMAECSKQAGGAIVNVVLGYADGFPQLDLLTGACEQAGLSIRDFTPEAEAVLRGCATAEEWDEGIASIDIGRDATELGAVSREGFVRTRTLAISAGDFTRDVASILNMSYAEAEALKCREGSAAPSDLSANVKPRPRQLQLREVLEARAGQFFHVLSETLSELTGRAELPGALLAGGGAELPGLCEVAEAVLDCPVRLAIAREIDDLPCACWTPAWAVACGLLASRGGAIG